MAPHSDTLLLSTKLKMPRPRQNYIIRKKLFGSLSRCANMGVIFVRGGAGTGKTTLISSFIKETGLKNTCWLSLDKSDTNVYTFWLYFTAAVNTVLKDDGGDFLELMRSNLDASNMEKLLTILINRLCGKEDYYIVLDDVHCIKDSALIRTFEFFIKSMPENFHIFMLSREDPPVYLGPLAVSGRLLYIDDRQMLLSPDESKTFLKQTLGISSNDEKISRISDYAEGWIGGLQLAAAAEAVGGKTDAFFRAGGGIAAEYLTREVYESLDPKEQEFLIYTGYLSYFDSGVCSNIFDDFHVNDFRSMIKKLGAKNLFLICVDEENGIYRYHNILSEYLSQRFAEFPEETKEACITRSATAFEKRGDCEEAMRLYCMDGDYKNVMRVARLMGGSIESWSYLEEIPAGVITTDTDLAIQNFMYDIGNFHMERAQKIFETLKERCTDTALSSLIDVVSVYFYKFVTGFPEYKVFTAEQIDSLNISPETKAIILMENSVALMEHSKYEKAEECIQRAEKTEVSGNVFIRASILGEKAQVCEETGRLNESLSCYDEIMCLTKSSKIMEGLSINFYIGLTGVYFRRMEISKAEEILSRSSELFENKRVNLPSLDVTLSFHRAELKFLSGDAAAGLAFVDGILEEYPEINTATLGRLIWELDCAGLLTRELSDRFLKDFEISGQHTAQPAFRLIRAKLLFGRGETEKALKETDEILTFSRSHKNRLRLVDSGLLKAFMLSKLPNHDEKKREIKNLFREAIHFSYENRYIMPFYIYRSAFLPLLRGLAAQDTVTSGLSRSEEAFAKDAANICSECSDVPKKSAETLSVRELDVLNELAKGITNREIAENLCISQATVKTHVLNIFGKLGVSSRMVAVEKGRKLGFIK